MSTSTLAPQTIDRTALRQHLFKTAQGYKPKAPKPDVHRDLAHGWLLPFLVELDDLLWGRWEYWAQCQMGCGTLPTAPIPEIDFAPADATTRKMLEASLNCIPQHGSWQTWGGWQFVNYFFDWLLFGFGHAGHQELPAEPHGCQGASNRLYQVFCLDLMLLHPYDYFGDLLAENNYGRGQGFFPTPHPICEMMTRMVFLAEEDNRLKTFMDPCVGTGRFPLHASNHTLRLYCMDIDATMCAATLVNAYLYMPWLAKPIAWLDRELAQAGEVAGEVVAQADVWQSDVLADLSDQMVESAPAHAQGYLFNSEYDAVGQAAVRPVIKRRRKATPGAQPALFE